MGVNNFYIGFVDWLILNLFGLINIYFVGFLLISYKGG